MGYLICDRCGGYYELQPGEKPEDFSNECECGGKLIYSDSLDVIAESNENIYSESNEVTGENNEENIITEEENIIALEENTITGEEDIIAQEEDIITGEGDTLTQEENTIDEEEPLINKKSKTIEDYKVSLSDKSKLKEIKIATEVQEILETKGHYIIKGNGNLKFIKILKEGIETDDGQLIKFEDIINIETIGDVTHKQKISSEKSGIGALISTGYQIFAPRKMTLKIIFNKGEIELNDVKISDAKRCVSFLKRRLNMV